MKLAIKPGSTDITLNVFIQDSSSTTGAGKTGLAYNTASLVCYYSRERGSATALSLVTQTVTGAHSDGGFVEIDATNMPGVYRLDLSDTIVGTGARFVTVMLKGAANMAPLLLEIDLNAEVNVTHFNGTAGTFASGRPEVNTTHLAGTSQTARDIGASVLLSSGTGTGQISLSSGAVLLQATQTGVTIPTVTTLTNLPSIPANWITAAGINADAFTAAKFAADVTTEFQAGLATAAELAKVPKSDSTVTWNATALASINAEVDTALADIHLDHLLATDYDPAAKPGVATALLNELIESDAGVSRYTANALENAPSGGSGVADWTTGEKEQIRSALGVDGTKTAATGGQLQTVDTVVDAIKVKTDYLPSVTPGQANGLFIAGSNAATGIATSLTANIVGNITGNLSGSIGSVGTDGITSTSIATDAIDAAAVKADAVTKIQSGLALASELSLVSGTADDIYSDVHTNGVVLTAAAVDAVLDEVVEGSYTMRQILRGLMAALAGKLSGAATTSISIRDTGDTKNRIVATVDSDGNRSAVTLDLT